MPKSFPKGNSKNCAQMSLRHFTEHFAGVLLGMNIGALSSGQISSIAQRQFFRLGFPGLIAALCGARGVTSNSLTYESLSLAIN